MEFILSKLLLFLIKPIVWVVCLFIVGVFAKKASIKRKFFVTGLVLLIFFSNGIIGSLAFNLYEASYPTERNYDVAIVLGGFSAINKRNNQIAFGNSSDRLFQAISLYKKGKIRRILISSGSANLFKSGPKEADLAAKYLKQIGIPDTVILIENQSRNTIENASYSAKIITEKIPNASVLVITSAWHIPRAKLIFSKHFKTPIYYYPTNYIGKSEYDWSDFIVPSTEALGNWEILFKEWIGLITDRFRK